MLGRDFQQTKSPVLFGNFGLKWAKIVRFPHFASRSEFWLALTCVCSHFLYRLPIPTLNFWNLTEVNWGYFQNWGDFSRSDHWIFLGSDSFWLSISIWGRFSCFWRNSIWSLSKIIKAKYRISKLTNKPQLVLTYSADSFLLNFSFLKIRYLSNYCFYFT